MRQKKGLGEAVQIVEQLAKSEIEQRLIDADGNCALCESHIDAGMDHYSDCLIARARNWVARRVEN